MDEINTPHDHFFKHEFGDRRMARAFFEEYLPQDIAEQCDWTTLDSTDSNYVDAELRETMSDLLYTVRIGGVESMLFLLFERQSSPDPMMALRLLGYMSRVWERWVRENPNRLLTPIWPIVLYEGEREWKVSVKFNDIDDPPWLRINAQCEPTECRSKISRDFCRSRSKKYKTSPTVAGGLTSRLPRKKWPQFGAIFIEPDFVDAGAYRAINFLAKSTQRLE